MAALVVTMTAMLCKWILETRRVIGTARTCDVMLASKEQDSTAVCDEYNSTWARMLDVIEGMSS